ncbi:MAG: CDGSH iron-sulfur domain-containing protein [Granulosicoccus sp.]|nr:CDGSH iron-sulfur domain-containing protein [Granulosicoccus sp.]
MSNGKATQMQPYMVEVEAGKSYFWCACGQSANQPYCDGSHKGSEFTPEKYTADKDGKVAFCGCRQSDNKPMCDGTHRQV